MAASLFASAICYALDHVAVPSGRTLWLCGEPGIPVGDVYHYRQDQAHLLQLNGHAVLSNIEELEHEYDAIFINCPKQHDETEGLMALALERSRGFVMAVARNDAGGMRLRGMMEAYGVSVESLAKSHCRIVWTFASPKADPMLVRQNIFHLASRPVTLEGEEWWSIPGLFSWDKVDPGSRLLMQHLPPDLSGRIADFGCGYGYISALLARRYPAIERIDAYDVDARAISCCARNNREKVKVIWHDIKALSPTPLYDAIIMNPPFHTEKDEDVNLGKTFIRRALESLVPGGRLFMVSNRHLAYEKVVPGLALIYQGEGYKIMTTCVP